MLRFCLLACICLPPAAAQQAYSVPKGDAPQLAPRGDYAVGVRTIDLVHTGQIDILHFDKASGKAPTYDRPLTVEVWYPAAEPKADEKDITYQMAVSDAAPGSTKEVDVPGHATRDAAPFAGRQFPLVIVSHGYPGSRYFLTYLTENLASKGYVVAAIDHTDSTFSDRKPFPSTLLNRSSDQLFTLNEMQRLNRKSDSFLHGIIKEDDAAIVGYSMGGYGALISAGAGISASSALNKFVPGGYLNDWDADSAKFKSLNRSSLKAVVAIAPWGEQAPMRAWDADGLAGIHIPALFIAGDHDDVAGFADGPVRAMKEAVRSDRCLLVYENARHNTGGNPRPDNLTDYQNMLRYDEPVWRKDRINEINQHFITAFLDLYLKGDQSRRAFLHVPVEKSNDGKWDVPPGTPDNGQFSNGDGFWPGFQRRWALGLEMSCYASGEAAK